MRRGLKPVLWVVGIIAFGWIAWLASIVVFGPRCSQARALALLRQEHHPAQGRNAFPALWLLGYDVRPAQIDAVYAQDRQRMPAWLAQQQVESADAPGKPIAGTVQQGDYTSVATAVYPALTPLSADERNLLCAGREVDCLAKVYAHADAVQSVLARHPRRLQQAEALDGYDYLWDDMPPNAAVPIPRDAGLNELLLSAAALDFAAGRRDQGIARICTNAATARRLHRQGNSLLGTLMTGVWLQSDARLFNQMLGELPPRQTLPRACGAAFAPVELADVDLCPSMQQEFRQLFGSLAGELDRTPAQRRLISLPDMQRMSAPTMAWACTAKVQAQMLADRRFGKHSIPGAQPGIYDRHIAPIGSLLVRLAHPDYVDYMHRQEDTAATLRLVATLLWLRQTRGDGSTLAARLAQRPAWMHVAADRDLHLSADGRRLQMGNHSSRTLPSYTWPVEAGRRG